jgi:hypothetical protein
VKKIASLKSAQLSFEKVTTQSQKMKKSVLGSRDGFASGSVARRDQALTKNPLISPHYRYRQKIHFGTIA